MKAKVSIFGVSGYTGTQLVSILLNHKKIELDAVFGRKSAGMSLSSIFPYNLNVPEKKIIDYENYNFKNCDLVFSCLPHGISQKVLNKIDPNKIIDLSADYRFDDVKTYEMTYNEKHFLETKNNEFVYGLPEINRDLIKKSNYISNPGCYPTSILIPIMPIIKSDFVKKKINLFIDSKSGISGAGKKITGQNQFMNINQNFITYNVGNHRHQSEMEQEISKLKKNYSITFLTQLLPISRGLQSTIFIQGLDIQADELRSYLNKYFANEMFVNILEKNKFPNLSNVVGTNNLLFGIFEDRKNQTIIIISIIDNLIKGASGQAVQNMNIILGFEENEGLENISAVS